MIPHRVVTHEEEKTDTSILSLTYHNFITPDDVTILDSDTTKLSVSKALIDKMGAKQLKGRRLTVVTGDRYLGMMTAMTQVPVPTT